MGEKFYDLFMEKIINIGMTNIEKEALLGYFEFTLVNMVEQLEQDGIIHGPVQVGAVFEAAYETLNEMERTMADHVELLQTEGKQ
jgi:hypothetical protein